MKKTCIAFYVCKGVNVRKCLLTYASGLWLHALRKVYNRTKLNRILVSACAGADRVLQSRSVGALNLLLHVLPHDFHIK